MPDRTWVQAAGDRILNPRHVEQVKQVREKLVFTMAGGDTRTFHYASEDRASEKFSELASFMAGLDIEGQASEFQV